MEETNHFPFELLAKTTTSHHKFQVKDIPMNSISHSKQNLSFYF